MATYAELFDLLNDAALRNKVAVAVMIAADTVRQEDPGTTNHANRLLWAKDALTNPKTMAQRMYPALLAVNNTLTVAQIQGATDAGIQSTVNNAIDIFATGA